ncbi:MAG: hypothetical protein NTX64_04515 [Elusimicrobia bacterium]|nr:hypothetical protein [Elusimicrobiota bacterium]
MRIPILVAILCSLAVGLRAQDNTLKQSVDVKVCNDDPLKVTLSASPDSVSPGEPTTLSWTSNHTAKYTLTDVGEVAGNSAVVTPVGTGNKTYTITAVDDCNKSGTASVTVRVAIKVFLSASMYSSASSVWQYMQWTTGYLGGGGNAEYSEFLADMRKWPSSAGVYKEAHVGGQTDIVDEDGNVLGHFQTASLLANGLPGLDYQGNPWAGDGYPHSFVADRSFIYNGQEYELVGFASVSPIILDLEGSGKPDVVGGQWLPHPRSFNKKHSAMFDINAIGFPAITEWVGPKSGLLVALERGESFKGGENLFGNPIGFLDGYQKLGMRFDKDNDGVVSGKELEGLYVWQDLNGNGKVDPGELKTVQELGITQIGAKQNNLKSTFVMNGKTRASWDWWPTCMIVYPTPKVAKAQ